MSISLPPEIWTHIIAQLPDASLHQIKHVNRMLYQIAEEIFGVLDLSMKFSSEELGKQLQVLSKRLQEAESSPLVVKKLSLSPGLTFQVYQTATETHAKPKSKSPKVLKRFFRNTDNQHNSSAYRLNLNEAMKMDDALTSLIPSFSSLHKLDYKDAIGWEGAWGSNFELALKVTSNRLTVLSLRFSFSREPSRAFLDASDKISFALPALQTFRLRLSVGPSSDFEDGVRKIIAAAPLLEELQYHIDSYGIHVPSHLMITATNPRLRIFKWTAATSTTQITAIPLSIPLSPLFDAHSSQYDTVQLNPASCIEAFDHIAFHRLVELRIDVSLLPREFYFPIASAMQLETLEITGVNSIYPENLFPHKGLRRLKRLYFGIAFELFNPKMLETLTTRLPNLETFVLLSEPQHGKWVYGTLWVTCDAISSQFRASTKIECNIRNFGIIPREWNRVGMSKISHLTQVLSEISRAVPSIASFYGTGSLFLWEGMEDDIEENWGGELWRQRHGSW
ncbi:hypothetical protein DL96DRAFT_1823759 [Flagelloscypha sp. PMI_526]|nr:hypothetical protein DL96DRAFT_1823759 [Flagelloscypha sp. PMI_526]